LVPPRGNAPRSIGYLPMALLLSYGGIKWLPNVDSHHDDPLNRRTCCFDIIGELPAPGLAPGTSAVRSGACMRISYTLRAFVKWSGTPVTLRVSRRPKRRGFLSSSCQETIVSD